MSYLTKEQNELLNNAYLRIRALNHPLRQSILSKIENARNSINVRSIYKELKLEQSVASMHLSDLRKQAFVKSTVSGKNRLYSVDDEAIKSFMDTVRKL